jgi:hypothetical protein
LEGVAVENFCGNFLFLESIQNFDDRGGRGESAGSEVPRIGGTEMGDDRDVSYNHPA